MYIHKEGTKQEISIRLCVESGNAREYFDEYDTLEEMSEAVSGIMADAMVKSAQDGVERMVGFVIAKNNHKEDFNSLTSREKWDTYKEAVGVWKCPKCQNLIPEGPQRCSPFPGASILCEECDCELTRRTGGGQSDPFEYRLYVE